MLSSLVKISSPKIGALKALSVILSLLLLSLFMSCSGGGGGGDSDSGSSPPDDEDAEFDPNIPIVEEINAFMDVTEAVNIDFVTEKGEVFDSSLTSGEARLQQTLGNGAAVGDYDSDGDLDILLLSQNGFGNKLYRNNLYPNENNQGTKTFTDVTPGEIADIDSLSRLAYFVDLDNDRDLDLLLINDERAENESTSKIFRNNGDGSFTNVTENSGFAPVGFYKTGCSLADYDKDGLLDIYISAWADPLGATENTVLSGANYLYKNMGNFIFEKINQDDDVLTPGVHSFTSIFTDFDNDTYPDIYLAVDFEEERFYSNTLGSGANSNSSVPFIDRAPLINIHHEGNDMGVAVADFDDDDDLDLYVTNITDITGGVGTGLYNTFQINLWDQGNGLVFDDQAADYLVHNTYWGWGTDFIDIENDGDLDLVAVTGMDDLVSEVDSVNSPVYQTPSVLFRNDAGHFVRVSSPGIDRTDDSRSLIVFDYDRDGDEDLLITNINQPAKLLENLSNTQETNHWLHLVLKPDNKAIGAKVYAEFNGLRKRRDIIAGKGYLSGNASEVHFGLGNATQVDTLTIIWADGVEQVYENVAADQLIEYLAP